MSQNVPECLKFFLNRSSVRNYTDKKIEPEIFDQIIHAGVQAPTSSHVQAFSIMNITDHEIRKKIFEISGNQKWILDASHFLVICADLFKVIHFSSINAETISQDAYLAALLDGGLVGMTLSLAAETFYIGSVMIGSVRNDISTIVQLLELPKGVMPLFGLCLGYYEKRKAPKPRLHKNFFVFENKYKFPKNSNAFLKEYHAKLNEYYQMNILEHAGLRSQTDKTWLEVVTKSIQNQKRANMGKDLKNQGFDFS